MKYLGKKFKASDRNQALKALKPNSILLRCLAATICIGGAWQSLPLLVAAQTAPQTAAGTIIRNTATGTYEDPNSPGNQINTTSNTVTVTVAEIAGITVVGSGITNNTNPGGPVVVGNLLIYTYTVTNVGNDITRFQIPNVATTTGPATVSGTLPGGVPNTLQYSLDGGVTWLNVPAGGLTTANIPVNGSVQVRVPITVQAGALPGDIIAVRLGQTPGDAQNQARVADGGDVYTVDADPAIAPANGVREASATQQIPVGNNAATRALATILKTRTAYNAVDTSRLDDDLITYGLSLRVENNDPTGSGITPAALAGIPITVDGTLGTPNTTRILVSDAIPANTVLNVAPTPPPGWQVVYSINDPATVTANGAAWTTTAPALGSIRRIGFINNPAVFTSVAPGATVTGFNIQVRTTVTPANPTTIYNIAQVAGTTSGNNDPATNKVYDNSGDQNPSNFAGGGIFPTTPDAGFVPAGTTPPNLDNNNNNTGANNTIGDFNPFAISVPNPLSILNGPNGAPAAVGPNNNNDDFTNKSALIAPNIAPGSSVDPAPVPFTNTVVNTGTTAGNIALIPTPPAVTTDLPNGSEVTISYQSTSATYTYNNTTGFTFLSGVGNAANGLPISATNALSIPAAAVPINSGATANYGVSVNLPTNTPLSTDSTAQGAPVTTTIQRGFPVPITAFLDVDNNGLINVDPAVEPRNITIDRVYTGFLQLLKESRILQGTGPAVQGTDGTFSIAAKRPAPGNIIEYRITYRNISEAVSGTGNVILNADKVVITEDGVAGTNNWALDSAPTNGVIDTSNVVGSAKDSGASTITFFNGIPAILGVDITGTTAATDVTKYVNTVTGFVAPQTTRTFIFQRKLN